MIFFLFPVAHIIFWLLIFLKYIIQKIYYKPNWLDNWSKKKKTDFVYLSSYNTISFTKYIYTFKCLLFNENFLFEWIKSFPNFDAYQDEVKSKTPPDFHLIFQKLIVTIWSWAEVGLSDLFPKYKMGLITFFTHQRNALI